MLPVFNRSDTRTQAQKKKYAMEPSEESRAPAMLLACSSYEEAALMATQRIARLSAIKAQDPVDLDQLAGAYEVVLWFCGSMSSIYGHLLLIQEQLDRPREELSRDGVACRDALDAFFVSQHELVHFTTAAAPGNFAAEPLAQEYDAWATGKNEKYGYHPYEKETGRLQEDDVMCAERTMPGLMKVAVDLESPSVTAERKLAMCASEMAAPLSRILRDVSIRYNDILPRGASDQGTRQWNMAQRLLRRSLDAFDVFISACRRAQACVDLWQIGTPFRGVPASTGTIDDIMRCVGIIVFSKSIEKAARNDALFATHIITHLAGDLFVKATAVAASRKIRNAHGPGLMTFDDLSELRDQHVAVRRDLCVGENTAACAAVLGSILQTEPIDSDSLGARVASYMGNAMNSRALFRGDGHCISAEERVYQPNMPQYLYYRVCRRAIYNVDDYTGMDRRMYTYARKDMDRYADQLADRIWTARNAVAVELDALRASNVEIYQEAASRCMGVGLSFIPIHFTENLGALLGVSTEPRWLSEYRNRVVGPFFTGKAFVRYMLLVRADAMAYSRVLRSGQFISDPTPIVEATGLAEMPELLRIVLDFVDSEGEEDDADNEAARRFYDAMKTARNAMRHLLGRARPAGDTSDTKLVTRFNPISLAPLDVESYEEMPFQPAATAAAYDHRHPQAVAPRAIGPSWISMKDLTGREALVKIRVIVVDVTSHLRSHGELRIPPEEFFGSANAAVVHDDHGGAVNFAQLRFVFDTLTEIMFSPHIAEMDEMGVLRLLKESSDERFTPEYYTGTTVAHRLRAFVTFYEDACKRGGVRYDIWFTSVLLRTHYAVQYSCRYLVAESLAGLRTRDEMSRAMDKGGRISTSASFLQMYHTGLHFSVNTSETVGTLSQFKNDMYKSLTLLNPFKDPFSDDHIDPTCDQFTWMWMGLLTPFIPRDVQTIQQMVVGGIRLAGSADPQAIIKDAYDRAGQLPKDFEGLRTALHVMWEKFIRADAKPGSHGTGGAGAGTNGTSNAEPGTNGTSNAEPNDSMLYRAWNFFVGNTPGVDFVQKLGPHNYNAAPGTVFEVIYDSGTTNRHVKVAASGVDTPKFVVLHTDHAVGEFSSIDITVNNKVITFTPGKQIEVTMTEAEVAAAAARADSSGGPTRALFVAIGVAAASVMGGAYLNLNAARNKYRGANIEAVSPVWNRVRDIYTHPDYIPHMKTTNILSTLSGSNKLWAHGGRMWTVTWRGTLVTTLMLLSDSAVARSYFQTASVYAPWAARFFVMIHSFFFMAAAFTGLYRRTDLYSLQTLVAVVLFAIQVGLTEIL